MQANADKEEPSCWGKDDKKRETGQRAKKTHVDGTQYTQVVGQSKGGCPQSPLASPWGRDPNVPL